VEEKELSNIEKYNQKKKDYKSKEKELEERLTQEWLDKGNKIKVFNRDFNDDDYQIGMVGRAKKDIYE
jgi:hypothetical protein